MYNSIYGAGYYHVFTTFYNPDEPPLSPTWAHLLWIKGKKWFFFVSSVSARKLKCPNMAQLGSTQTHHNIIYLCTTFQFLYIRNFQIINIKETDKSHWETPLIWYFKYLFTQLKHKASVLHIFIFLCSEFRTEKSTAASEFFNNSDRNSVRKAKRYSYESQWEVAWIHINCCV